MCVVWVVRKGGKALAYSLDSRCKIQHKPSDPRTPATQDLHLGPSTMADYIDLHELSKGWKAAIIRATDPSTKYVSN